MFASYKWIVGCTVLIGFLGGTLAYAKPIDVEQQIPKRNRDGMTVLTMSLHGAGPFYSAKRRNGLTDLVPDPENTAFDIFCSVFDTEWLEPGQYRLTPDALRLRGLGSKPAMPTPRRYQLRPC